MAPPLSQQEFSLVEAVAAAWPADRWRDVHVVVALSGGADSMALLRALLEIHNQTPGAGRLLAAHFNHCLRGAESDADEEWVRTTCAGLGLPLVVGRRDCSTPVASNEHGASDEHEESEASARDLRYAFLRQTAEELGARFVATAHTRDDQVETILFRILRGSGLAGLAGIPFTRSLTTGISVVRPLLEIRREEIEAYLGAIGQAYCHDRTNRESHFTRNWIRNELLPPIRARMGDSVEEALLGLSAQAAETQEWIDRQAAALVGRAFAIDAGGATVSVDLSQLANEPPLLVCEAFRQAWRRVGWPEQAMGRQQWRRLAGYACARDPGPAITLPGEIRVEPLAGRLVLAPGPQSRA